MSTDNAQLAGKYGMPAGEVAKLRTVFDEIDADKDETLNPSEIQQAMKSVGQNVPPKALKAMIKAADRNGNGSLQFQEFVAIVSARIKVGAKCRI